MVQRSLTEKQNNKNNNGTEKTDVGKSMSNANGNIVHFAACFKQTAPLRILIRSTDQIVIYITLQASWQQNLNLTNCKFSRKILHKHEKDVTTRKRFQVTIAIRKKL